MSATPLLGEIILFAGNYAPRGWMLCHGQFLNIADNTALFSLLGTTYGGNGTTTFALPDLRGRTPVGAGTGPGLSPRNLGDRGGAEQATLTASNMPAHQHPVRAASTAPTTGDPGGSSLAGATIYASAAPTTSLAPTGSVGGSQPFGILPPFLSLHYIIAVQGVFPSRS